MYWGLTVWTYKYKEVCCEEEILDKIGHAALHDDLSFLVSQADAELILSANTLVIIPFIAMSFKENDFDFWFHKYNTGKVVIKLFWSASISLTL